MQDVLVLQKIFPKKSLKLFVNQHQNFLNGKFRIGFRIAASRTDMATTAKRLGNGVHIYNVIAAQANLVLAIDRIKEYSDFRAAHFAKRIDDIAQVDRLDIEFFHILLGHDGIHHLAVKAHLAVFQNKPGNQSLFVGTRIVGFVHNLREIDALVDQVAHNVHGPLACTRVLERARVVDNAQIKAACGFGADFILVHQEIQSLARRTGLRFQDALCTQILRIADMMVYVACKFCAIDTWHAICTNSFKRGGIQKEGDIAAVCKNILGILRQNEIGTLEDSVCLGELFQKDLDIDLREVILDIIIECKGRTNAIPIRANMPENGGSLDIQQHFINHRQHPFIKNPLSKIKKRACKIPKKQKLPELTYLSVMQITIHDFTGVYSEQPFLQTLRDSSHNVAPASENVGSVTAEEKTTRVKWLDSTQISGTDCYCDDDAVAAIREQIANAGIENAEGIHFFDNGNYHYMSKIWTDMVQEPFSLIVFDHHPDMHPPRFGDILSCGGWVTKALDENKFIDNVVIIGVADHLVDEIREEIASHPSGARIDKVSFIPESEIANIQTGSLLTAHSSQPLYISIDKDALAPAFAATNWDQGSLRLEHMKSIISEIAKDHRIIGVDICGERAYDFEGNEQYTVSQADALNNGLNRELAEFLLEIL